MGKENSVEDREIKDVNAEDNKNLFDSLPLNDFRVTVDPLFPFLSQWISSKSWNAFPGEEISAEMGGIMVDQDILRSCLSHRNTVDTLALRLDYLKKKSMHEEFLVWKKRNGYVSCAVSEMENSCESDESKGSEDSHALSSLISTVEVDDSETDEQLHSDSSKCYDTGSFASPSVTKDLKRSIMGGTTKYFQSLASTQDYSDLPCTENEQHESWIYHLPLNFSSAGKVPSERFTECTPLTCIVPDRIRCRSFIEGIEVLGPYPHWLAPQKEVLSSLLKTVKEGGNALLESPTGTGKTAALLCGLLAWQCFLKQQYQSKEQHIPVVFFCTRTHSQISQIIQEIKKIPYCPITACLASPKHLCPYLLSHENQTGKGDDASFRIFCRTAVSIIEKKRLDRFYRISRLMNQQRYTDGLNLMIKERYRGYTENYTSRCNRCPFYTSLDNPRYAEQCFKALVPHTDFSAQTPEGHSCHVCTLKNMKGSENMIWDLEELRTTTLGKHFSYGSFNSEKDSQRSAAVPHPLNSGHLCGCPYYTAHALSQGAELIVLPYQFLLNPTLLSRNHLALDKAIIVFDEAHNIEQASCDEGSSKLAKCDIIAFLQVLKTVVFGLTGQSLEEYITGSTSLTTFSARSTPLTGAQLGTIYSACLRLTDHYKWSSNVSTAFSLSCSLWLSFKALVNSIDALVLSSQKTSHGVEGFPCVLKDWGLSDVSDQEVGCESFFKEIGYDTVHIGRLTSYISSLYDTICHGRSGDTQSENDSVVSSVFEELMSHFRFHFFIHLTNFFEILMLCFQYKRCYVASLIVLNSDMDWEIKINLMIPIPIMELLCNRARSVILISGTLSPMKSLVAELGSSFTSRVVQTVQTHHIINKSQLVVLATFNLICKAFAVPYSLVDACCTATNLRDPCFLSSLGHTIVCLVRLIPGGVVVFFPSYRCLTEVVDIWRKTVSLHDIACFNKECKPSLSIWEELSRLKGIPFVEPKSQKDFLNLLNAYCSQINMAGSAVVLAVYRGKISEGLSLGNEYIRGVVCVGIPYPNLKSPLVIQKRRFNDHLINQHIPLTSLCGTGSIRPRNDSLGKTSATSLSLLTGNKWYQLQAFRALNQAMGRVIRHKSDYGVIILLDSRHTKMIDKTDKNSTGPPHEITWKHNFSKWLQPFLYSCSFYETLEKLKEFFKLDQSSSEQNSCGCSLSKKSLSCSISSLPTPSDTYISEQSQSLLLPTRKNASLQQLSALKLPQKGYKVSSLRSLYASSSWKNGSLEMLKKKASHEYTPLSALHSLAESHTSSGLFMPHATLKHSSASTSLKHCSPPRSSLPQSVLQNMTRSKNQTEYDL